MAQRSTRPAAGLGGESFGNGVTGGAAFLVTAALQGVDPLFSETPQHTAATAVVVMGVLNVIVNLLRTVKARYIMPALVAGLLALGTVIAPAPAQADGFQDTVGRIASAVSFGVDVDFGDGKLTVGLAAKGVDGQLTVDPVALFGGGVLCPLLSPVPQDKLGPLGAFCGSLAANVSEAASLNAPDAMNALTAWEREAFEQEVQWLQMQARTSTYETS